MTNAGPHLFWITSRAAGTAAIVLANATTSVGLAMGGRLVRGRRATDLRALHETLSLACLAAIAVHGVALLGDRFLHPGLLDIAIPFVGRYRPLWTGLGIGAGWLLALLGLSYYARRRVGAARWRRLHRWTALAWVLSVVHVIGSGTDMARGWYVVLLAVTTAPAAVLLAWRLSLNPPILAANPSRGSRPSADRRLPKGAHPEVRRRSTLDRTHDRDSSTMIGGSRLSGPAGGERAPRRPEPEPAPAPAQSGGRTSTGLWA